MRIVIDANRVIASMIRGGSTRQILFDPMFEFFAPENLLNEIMKHERRITEASGLSKEEFKVLMLIVSENITTVRKSDYEGIMAEIMDSMKDPQDVPYVAVCLAVDAEGIWTHDPHFRVQSKTQVFTNIDMLRKAGKAKS